MTKYKNKKFEVDGKLFYQQKVLIYVLKIITGFIVGYYSMILMFEI